MTAGRFSTDVYAQRLSPPPRPQPPTPGWPAWSSPRATTCAISSARAAQTFERLTALVLPAAGEPTVVVPRLELASLKESAVTELGLAVRDWVDGEDPYRLVADALGGPRRSPRR